MSCLLLLACLSIVPINTDTVVLTDKFDMVELNHFYDGEGRHTFDQLLFYRQGFLNRKISEDKSETVETLVIQAWRIVATVPNFNGIAFPTIERKKNKIIFTFVDKKDGMLRKVETHSFAETWTQFDTETSQEQREFQHLRSELHKVIQFPKIILPEVE